MRRKFLTTIFILFGALLPVSPALAAPEDDASAEVTDESEDTENSWAQYGGSDGYDIGYTGPIDIVSGQPVEENGDDDDGGELVRISEGVNFDRFSQRYIFSVGKTICQPSSSHKSEDTPMPSEPVNSMR